jgi:hypothetical protein
MTSEITKQLSLRISAYEHIRLYTHEVEPIDTGSYQWSTLFLARIALLRALEIYAPSILTELRQVQLDYENEAPHIWEVLWNDPMNDALKVLALFPKCEKAILELLFKYNLFDTKDHWMLRVLISHLRVNVKPQMSHTASKVAVIPPVTVYNDTILIDDFNFGAAAWNPSIETRINYEKRVSSTFEIYLSKYMTQVSHKYVKKGLSNYESQGLRKGLVPTDTIRFVHYQVLRQSFEAIANVEADILRKHVPKQTVTEGVKRYSALAGVLLRPRGRSGRKRIK